LSEPASAPLAAPESTAVAAPVPDAGARDLPPLAGPEVRSTPRTATVRTTPVEGTAQRARPAASRAPAEGRTEAPTSLVRRPAPAAPPSPRLQLDPLDVSLAIERDPVLKLSLSLLSEPTSNEQERAAAAQLWKALNASPEDILRDAQKLSVLEAEAKGLREQEARNKAALQDMEAEVQKTRYMTWLVYLMGALLLASLAGLFWLARRKQGSAAGPGKQWWAPGSTAAAKVAVPAAQPASLVKSKSSELDLDLGEESDMMELHASRGLGDSESLPLSVQDRRDFPGSQIGVSRSVATEELFDVQQQSDFFVSLGEFEQAIGVLRTHISESQEPGALAYLDLFKLYHKLDRRADYEKLRTEFNHQFNAGAPPFDQYSDESRGLETYETAFGRIQALWPQARVLDVIENSIFRDAADPESEVFDLEAYREMLLLHAIAKEVIQRDAAGSSDFQHTSIRPLKAAGPKAAGASLVGEAAERMTQPLDDIPHASPRLGLDVDLDELQEASAFEASLPEVLVPVEPTAKSAQPQVGSTAAGLAPGNLIDFEVLDFMPPDGNESKPS
jgi:hypothetical protein